MLQMCNSVLQNLHYGPTVPPSTWGNCAHGKHLDLPKLKVQLLDGKPPKNKTKLSTPTPHDL